MTHQQPFRWGIIGTGNIAGQFARGLSALPDHQLVAVGSRSQQSADAFGETFGVPHRHPTYEALVRDADVDAVYVSTPHTLHHANTLLALEHGKHVLCEKPFAINARESAEMIAAARSRNLVLIEAMWTRFLPGVVQARQWIADGKIGEVRALMADFGFRTEFDPQHRLFNPELGGGALLDVGIYPISLASAIFGPPATISSSVVLGSTGVDEQAAAVFGYTGGQVASLFFANRTNSPKEATILGTEGYITLHAPWFIAERVTLQRDGEEPVLFAPEPVGNGYNYEAAELARCVRAGEQETPMLPLDETLAIVQTLDAIRAEWGLVYPQEREA